MIIATGLAHGPATSFPLSRGLAARNERARLAEGGKALSLATVFRIEDGSCLGTVVSQAESLELFSCSPESSPRISTGRHLRRPLSER